MENIIEIKNLTKNYTMNSSKVCGINTINLNIKKGEYCIILGQSGSGKSTLMNIIGGLMKPDSGSVNVCNKNIGLLNDRQISYYRNKIIGFIFQSFNLIPSLTAIENAALPLLYRNINYKIRLNLAYNSLKKVGLEKRIYHKPNELSGGQRQRVSVARAIITKPEIILADEPTGNLDTKSGQTVMDILKLLNFSGYTIILITHNQKHIKYANHIIELSDGIISRDYYINNDISRI